MTEDRKYAILFATTLLCARRLIETIESDKPNMAEQFFIDRAIQKVEFILERIDNRHPTPVVSPTYDAASLDTVNPRRR